jgi:poly-beta-1,6-N-acetyl-D-glucosamine synthase
MIETRCCAKRDGPPLERMMREHFPDSKPAGDRTEANMRYVLITPARNEAMFIEKTLQSVVAQTLRPERWVIVDDGSTDATADIVQRYSAEHSWIELIRRPVHKERNFAGKVGAFNEGLERMRSREFDILGNLDADLSFEPDYLAFLIERFEDDPRLGVAGTPFVQNGYDSAVDSFEGEAHVAGGCQLFRRECFEQIGGYKPNPAGGIDWIAVTTARMIGWKTRSFSEKRFVHYRSLGTAEKKGLSALFSYGEKDYYLGGSPIWEVFRVAYRATKRPRVLGGLTLLAGYCWAAVRRLKRPVSRELMQFHRHEQMEKLRNILQALARGRKIDSFRVAGSESSA